MWKQLLKQYGLVAVLRASSTSEALTLARAIYKGGIRFIEVTFTVPKAPEVIRLLKADFDLKEAQIGAGTLLNISQAKEAVNAGATYLVSPHFDPEIALYAKDVKIPYAPGCMTLTEMITAMRYDVDVIKLFPGSVFGASYIKALKGPLPHLNIMPTGGVSLNNLQDWFKAGAIACGIGSDLTAPFEKEGINGVIQQSRNYVEMFNFVIKEMSNE